MGAFLTHPYVQGSFQAFGGFAEASLGAKMLVGSWGAAAPLAWPMIVHGMDHFTTGLNTILTGQSRDTLTSQLLQTTGMPAHTANMIDSGMSIAGNMTGTAVIRSAEIAAPLILPMHNPISPISQNGQILFGQKTVAPIFSITGNFNSRPISEIVQGLRNGTISPEALPIKIIVRNGQKITLNNRSLLALRRAGIQPKVVIDKTGIKKYEEVLDEHLRGSLPSDVIRIRGGPPGTSYIGPIK